jgi:hypothetical protein
MTDFDRIDPYNEIAVVGMLDFELRADGLAVPLHFKPDAAFIVRTVLEQETEFTRNVILEKPRFRELCEGAVVTSRFPGVFSDLRFTFDALGSTLIQTAHKRGTSNVYICNPNYAITDEQGLLSPTV